MPRGPRPAFTTLTAQGYLGTTVAKLTHCVDKIRDLYTQFGARPYAVALVRTRWSGGRRDDGVEEVVAVTPVLPTPLVAPPTGLRSQVQPVGLDELGDLRVSQISAAYAEEELRGLGPAGEPIPADESFYWEITFPKPNGADLRRRFFPAGPPALEALGFQWAIDLTKSGEDRARNGDPEG